MFKQQAHYLVKRRQLELWAQVLAQDNLHRRQLIDQVRRVSTIFVSRCDLKVLLDCGNCAT